MERRESRHNAYDLVFWVRAADLRASLLFLGSVVDDFDKEEVADDEEEDEEEEEVVESSESESEDDEVLAESEYESGDGGEEEARWLDGKRY